MSRRGGELVGGGGGTNFPLGYFSMPKNSTAASIIAGIDFPAMDRKCSKSSGEKPYVQFPSFRVPFTAKYLFP